MMEFQEFWKQRERMCKTRECCCPPKGEDCPMTRLGTSINSYYCAEIIEKHYLDAEQIVERWSKDNPIVTNRDKYEEIMIKFFGEAFQDEVMRVCATDAWWNQEYKEPEGK